MTKLCLTISCLFFSQIACAESLMVAMPRTVRQGSYFPVLITDSITDSNCCEVIFQNKKHTAYAFDVFNEKRAHLALVPVGFVEIPGKAMVRIGRAGYEYLDRTIQIEKVNFPVSPQIFLVRKPTAAGKERRRQETEILLNIYSNEISERYFDGSLKFTSLLAEMETTSPFGKIRRKRMHNNGKEIRWDHYHGGVDLRARVGTPVFAAESGIARIAQKWLGSGNTIILDHGQGLLTFYFHLSKMK